MRIVETVADLRACVAAFRTRGERVGLVPTMGNLHDGHLSLIDTARGHGAGAVVVSIFVNPLQFGPKEDFATYPRTPEEDHAALAARQVALVFAPGVDEMYPGGQGESTRVEVPGLSTILCGHFRPGHFVGVATVVTKLFNMVQPDLAVFGEKDYQQVLVIRRMVRDLCLPLEIVASATVREDDGLAMSSRNRFLSAEERARAPELHRALREGAAAVELRRIVLRGDRGTRHGPAGGGRVPAGVLRRARRPDARRADAGLPPSHRARRSVAGQDPADRQSRGRTTPRAEA